MKAPVAGRIRRRNTTTAQLLGVRRPGSMVRMAHVVVCGARRAGKTCALKMLALNEDGTAQPYRPTMDDTFVVQLETPQDKPRQLISFHDTAGIDPGNACTELKKCYLACADAFVLVLDAHDVDSIKACIRVKASIDRHYKDAKTSLPMVVMANTHGQTNPEALQTLQAWTQREQISVFTVDAKDRHSLVEPVMHLAGRLFQTHKTGGLLAKGKSLLKSEKSSASAIQMDL